MTAISMSRRQALLGTAAMTGAATLGAAADAYGAWPRPQSRRIRLHISIASTTARCRRPWSPTASCRSASRRAASSARPRKRSARCSPTTSCRRPMSSSSRTFSSSTPATSWCCSIPAWALRPCSGRPRQAAGEPQGRRHRSQGHRRRGGDARPLRPRLGHHGGRRQPQFPQRADLHLAGRFRLLDRRDEADDEGSGLHEAVRGGRAQEPAAQPRPHGVLQGRTGVPAGHPGHVGARPYRRPHRRS